MPGPSTAAPVVAATTRRRAPEGARERRAPSVPTPRPARTPAPAPQEAASDVVRWAAFSCVLVPVVLVGYGTSLAGAGGAALGLAAVTGVCRVLLQQSERGAARARAQRGAGTRGRRQRQAPGAHRGGRRPGPDAPVD
ncbi:hypothetical protein [Streptomyces flavofungini]|uniref:hypothetical protein n=1 Tax=Streptomyces flavofungini TaxID=68200 RepID=UPI001994614F|nr:hypothetical protein GCM10010349_05160 [Streptomyces flavofungini]